MKLLDALLNFLFETFLFQVYFPQLLSSKPGILSILCLTIVPIFCHDMSNHNPRFQIAIVSRVQRITRKWPAYNKNLENEREHGK